MDKEPKQERKPPPPRIAVKAVSWIAVCGVVLGCLGVRADAITVEVGTQDNSPVEIVLCAGKTDMDLEDFATRLETALVQAGVARERIKITASELKQYSSIGDGLLVMKDQWTKFPSNAEEAHLNREGWLRGPYADIARGSGYVDMIDVETSGFCLAQLTFARYCPYCPAGVSTRAHIKGQSVKMYFASLEDYMEEFGKGKCAPTLYYYEGNLQNLQYQCGSLGLAHNLGARQVAKGLPVENGFRGSYTQLDGEEVPVSGSVVLRMESAGNVIQVYVNDELSIVYTDTENKIPQGTCLFACAYATHTGISAAEFSIGGLTPLIEAVRSPKWESATSHRFYVDVCDEPREDFDLDDQMGELAERIGSDGGYYIGWGTNSSKASINSFVNRLAGKGTYISSRAADVYDQTARYIEPIVNRRFNGEGEVVLIKDKEYNFTTKES